MVGSYGSLSLTSLPHPSFETFASDLRDAARENVADAMEASYESLSVDTMKDLLMFSSVEELMAYVQDGRPDWDVDPVAGVKFVQGERGGRAEGMSMVGRCLGYAEEVERIV